MMLGTMMTVFGHNDDSKITLLIKTGGELR